MVVSVGYVTVSAKVRRELWEKLRKYNVNVSEVIREALARKVREIEVEWALKVMDEISSKAKLHKPSSEIIRELRDER